MKKMMIMLYVVMVYVFINTGIAAILKPSTLIPFGALALIGGFGWMTYEFVKMVRGEDQD